MVVLLVFSFGDVLIFGCEKSRVLMDLIVCFVIWILIFVFCWLFIGMIVSN